MQRIGVWGLAAIGLFSACGCANTGTIARGQSPAALQQASFGNRGPVHEVMTDHFHGRDVTHYSVGPGGAQPAYMPQGGGYNCPPGGGYGPGYGCPSGQCGNGPCNFPHHGYSFSYERPSDLSYPAQNQPGGAVVYPYYTHKGPSDFFRKE